ncbi:calcineurin-like phosphoesterase family protein [Algoriphagus boseongensis]|uniref:Calcineurin-like phosphoesterase family protein n=1 Tax=Algoriphagus boseongensis TaxID=1442587 RepID=A0A4R6T1R9_9BACT|nr:metallophosphoesterase family protein [Algoriphagus boseongensis]TDQ13568.1 calcineurin-like phosphoesterase family protein [Algoriphagus boseongensis]
MIRKISRSASFLFLLMLISTFSFSQEKRVYKEPKFHTEWSKPSEYPDRIVLNFGQNPGREVNVTWRTDASITQAFAEIAIASAAPKFWKNGETLKAKTEVLDAREIQDAEVLAHYHSVEFQNLLPDTIYAYRVGDGERWSEWFQFRTASEKSGEKFSFLYVGDAQNYVLELWSRLIREGFRTAPDAKFFIHAGDLINSAHREQEWHEWFTAGGFIHSMIPSFPTPGNHEYRAKNQEEVNQKQRSLSVQWRPQFTLPLNGPKGLEETVYYMDYQDVRVISLDSNRDQVIQAVWLEEVLKTNPKKWTVLTYHHPLFSASNGRDNVELRELWKPIFDKYRVDIALQGHDHAYARGRVSPGENVMEGVNLKDQTGTVYVVSVSGGKMYDIGDDWTAKGGQRDRIAENTQLFQVITVEGDRMKYESYTAIGELYDAFELVKGKNGINEFIELRVNAVPEKTHKNTIPYKD